MDQKEEILHLKTRLSTVTQQVEQLEKRNQELEHQLHIQQKCCAFQELFYRFADFTELIQNTKKTQ
jgi:predicted RNase H-like nuclease (RuvC/YqgF family)